MENGEGEDKNRKNGEEINRRKEEGKGRENRKRVRDRKVKPFHESISPLMVHAMLHIRYQTNLMH